MISSFFCFGRRCVVTVERRAVAGSAVNFISQRNFGFFRDDLPKRYRPQHVFMEPNKSRRPRGLIPRFSQHPELSKFFNEVCETKFFAQVVADESPEAAHLYIEESLRSFDGVPQKDLEAFVTYGISHLSLAKQRLYPLQKLIMNLIDPPNGQVRTGHYSAKLLPVLEHQVTVHQEKFLLNEEHAFIPKLLLLKSKPDMVDKMAKFLCFQITYKVTSLKNEPEKLAQYAQKVADSKFFSYYFSQLIQHSTDAGKREIAILFANETLLKFLCEGRLEGFVANCMNIMKRGKTCSDPSFREATTNLIGRILTDMDAKNKLRLKVEGLVAGIQDMSLRNSCLEKAGISYRTLVAKDTASLTRLDEELLRFWDRVEGHAKLTIAAVKEEEGLRRMGGKARQMWRDYDEGILKKATIEELCEVTREKMVKLLKESPHGLFLIRRMIEREKENQREQIFSELTEQLERELEKKQTFSRFFFQDVSMLLFNDTVLQAPKENGRRFLVAFFSNLQQILDNNPDMNEITLRCWTKGAVWDAFGVQGYMMLPALLEDFTLHFLLGLTPEGTQEGVSIFNVVSRPPKDLLSSLQEQVYFNNVQQIVHKLLFMLQEEEQTSTMKEIRTILALKNFLEKCPRFIIDDIVDRFATLWPKDHKATARDEIERMLFNNSSKGDQINAFYLNSH